MRFHFSFMLSLAVVASVGAAQDSVSGPPPAWVEAERIHYVWRADSTSRQMDTNSVAIEKLTSQAQGQIKQFIATLPKFAEYPYSGCHDRAHAVYMLMPPSLKKYAAKSWIFSPERVTISVTGTIGLRRQAPPGGPPVSWGYHVALAFDKENELLVYDVALAPDSLITLRAWYDMMRIPTLSMATMLDANGYNVLDHEGGGLIPNPDVFRGMMHWYGGQSLNEEWIPKSLARDKVGEAILYRNACPQLIPSIGDAGSLQSLLNDRRMPAQCQALQALFDSEVTRWRGILANAPASGGR